MPRQELARQASPQQPQQGLICVGTSATVGDGGNSAELRKYAADVFGQAFDEDVILREERQSIDGLLGTAIIQTRTIPQPNLTERVDPGRYADAESYLKAQQGCSSARRLRAISTQWIGASRRLRSCGGT